MSRLPEHELAYGVYIILTCARIVLQGESPFGPTRHCLSSILEADETLRVRGTCMGRPGIPWLQLKKG